MPFAVKLLPGFPVDGTWNVPTTLGGRHMECAYYFDFCRLCLSGAERRPKAAGIEFSFAGLGQNDFYALPGLAKF